MDKHKSTIKRCIRHASEYGAPSKAVDCSGIFRICNNCPEQAINQAKLNETPWPLKRWAV